MKVLNPALIESLNVALVARGYHPLDIEQIECMRDYSREHEALDMLDDVQARCDVDTEDMRDDVLCPRVIDERAPHNVGPYPLPSAVLLATVFASAIRYALTEKQIMEVNRLNRDVPDECGTHEFCDANEYMNDALNLLSLEFSSDETLLNLINKAWGIARLHGFNPDMIVQEGI